MLDRTSNCRDGMLTVNSCLYGREVLVISLAGELDRANFLTAEAVLNDAAASDASLLVIDLDGLDFIDSSGIALLISLSEVRGEEDSLRILPSRSSEVARTLEVTGVGALIEIAADRKTLAV